MRRPVVLGACGTVTLALSVLLSNDRLAGQATFRTGVDLVDVEVSVLDRNRLPGDRRMASRIFCVILGVI